MPSEIIIFQSHIGGVQTRQDRSIKVTLITALEMTDANELARLFSLNDQVVTVCLKTGMVTDADALALPEPEPDFRGEKSPAQRLRGVLYHLWEQEGKKGDFELNYRRHMERLITRAKERLA